MIKPFKAAEDMLTDVLKGVVEDFENDEPKNNLKKIKKAAAKAKKTGKKVKKELPELKKEGKKAVKRGKKEIKKGVKRAKKIIKKKYKNQWKDNIDALRELKGR
jgi:F0F1-type ATP synthase membrane subunit b/b'